MIIEQLQKNIQKRILEEPLFKKYFDNFEMIKANNNFCDSNIINLEIRGQETENELTKFLMLELYIREDKQIIITNIFIPFIMRQKGFGMKILSIIFELAKKENYALFISDMVQSFYNKMLQKNAIQINEETVQIINETKLFRL
mgnify:FL=1